MLSLLMRGIPSTRLCATSRRSIWIAMMKRQCRNTQRIADRDVEQGDIVQLQLIGHEQIERLAQMELAQADLDRHLPHARYTEKDVVARRFNERAGMRAERCVVLNKPDEAMGIEEHIHAMYSRKSSRGA